MRTVYVNGDYVPEDKAKVSVFDRGFLFADAIYEVAAVLDGKLADFPAHTKRLHRSAGELGMRIDVSDDDLLEIHRQLVTRNGIDQGMVYLQLTRGAVDRDFFFDTDVMTPTLVLFTQKRPLIETAAARNGLKIATMEDLRWGRCDIKTTQLLYPSLAKVEAVGKGADDAWLVRDGEVMEGTSNNAFIVARNGAIITRPLTHSILPGITRATLKTYAETTGTTIEERAFTVAEAQNAAEAFVTSASALVTPVISIDGIALSDGKPGPVTLQLRDLYIAETRKRLL